MNIYNLFIEQDSLFFEFSFILVFSIILFIVFIKIISIRATKDLTKNNIQNIHRDYTSRLGGLIIFICFLLTSLYIYFVKSEYSFLFKIIFFGIPFIVIILIEDFYQNINPFVRFIFLAASSLLFCLYGIENLPIIEIPLLGTIINLPIVSIVFYALCITAYINGVNFIDGTNGLASLTILTSLFCLLFLTLILNDTVNAKIIVYTIAVLIAFIFLNYPFGKIFLGDLGAYYIGWVTAIMVIKIMVDNPQIPNWSAVTILSYPIIEVVFSFFRKVKSGKNPFFPDREHLHLKLFFTLEDKINNNLYANSLVAPFLSLIWLMPLVIIPWIYSSKFLVLISVVFQVLIYFFFYRLIPKKQA